MEDTKQVSAKNLKNTFDRENRIPNLPRQFQGDKVYWRIIKRFHSNQVFVLHYYSQIWIGNVSRDSHLGVNSTLTSIPIYESCNNDMKYKRTNESNQYCNSFGITCGCCNTLHQNAKVSTTFW